MLNTPAIALPHPGLLLAAVCALALMSTAGVAMPYPILAPIFVGGAADAFTRFAGLPPELLMGIALAVNPLGILLGSLVLGPMSDRWGRRAVLVGTLVACAAGYLLTALALHQRAYLLFTFARFATGLAEGNTAVARALLADLHPWVDRTRSFALLNASLYVGWLLGPLVGGWTLPLGEPVPFLLAAAAMLPCLALLAWGLPALPRAAGPAGQAAVAAPRRSAAAPPGESPAAAPAPASGWLAALRAQNTLGLLRQDPLLLRLFVLHLAYTVGLTTLYEFAPLWMLTEAGFDSRAISLATAAQCAVMTGTSLLAGRLGRRHRPLAFAAWMALAGATGLAALAVLPGGWGVATMITLGVPLALYSAVLPAWVSERFAAHGQGRVMGLLSTIFCLANVAVALAGSLLSLLQVRWTMALGGTACLLSALALARWARQETAHG